MPDQKLHPRAGREMRDRISLRQLIRRYRLASRIRGYRDIQGWLTPNEATHLCFFASQLEGPDKTIVEIGSWKGKSTLCLARGLRDGTVFAIDPFNAAAEEASRSLYEAERGQPDLLDQFRENMEAHGLAGRVEPLKGYSQDFADRFERIDLLFIDGDHSIEGCKFDYEHFAPRVVPGGYLLFHDYRPRKPQTGPTHVIHEQVLTSGEFEKVGMYDSLWVARRVN